MPLQSRQGAPCTRPGTHTHTHTSAHECVPAHVCQCVCARGWVGERCQEWCIHISLSKTHQRFRPPSPVNRNKTKTNKKSNLKSIFLSCYFRAWALGIFLGLVGLGAPHSLGRFWTARRGLRLPPRWCIAKCKRRQPSCGGPSSRKKMKKKKKKKKSRKTTRLRNQQAAFRPCPHMRGCVFFFTRKCSFASLSFGLICTQTSRWRFCRKFPSVVCVYTGN